MLIQQLRTLLMKIRKPNTKITSFVQIVPERLKQAKYDTLVLQGGCNEVTKINLASENITAWKKKFRYQETKYSNFS